MKTGLNNTINTTHVHVKSKLSLIIIITKYYSVDTWVCPFIVHIKEGGFISLLETVIYSKLKS